MGAKALTKAIRQTFGRHTPIQRCQIHKARNILKRLPKHLHVSVRKALRRVCRNVKRRRDACMALRWATAGMMEAAKSFTQLKVCKRLPALRAALNAHHAKHAAVEEKSKAA